ncbi:DUF6923 family protein [Microbacterium gorillae]|uniref:DUF7927 domain-containing protein n=1 Tax=Microbacterium gorillae TaxID=1231063 RepID=UPI003D9610BB
MAALVASAFSASFLATAPAASAAPGDPFNLSTPAVWIGQGNPTGLYESVQTGTGSVFEPVGGPSSLVYNSLGFRASNGYLYGLEVNAATQNRLVRIGQEGQVTTLGLVTGLYNDPNGASYNQGTFGSGADADKFYVRHQAQGNSLRIINVDTLTATNVTLSQTVPNLSDIFYLNGFVWGVFANAGGSTIYRMNPVSGGVTSYPLPQLTGFAFGAQWVYGNGNIGLSENNSGTVTQLKITGAGGASPTFTVVSTHSGPSSTNNDGAAWAGLPVDLGITKTAASDTVSPGGQVSYTLTVTNNSVGADSSGFTISDALPSQLTNPQVPTGCSIVGSTVTCTGGALAAGASTDFVISGTVNPAVGIGVCFDNVASVLGNEADPNAANDSATEQVCTVGTGELAITKTSNATANTRVGDTVTYTVTATNVGNGDFTAANPAVVFDDLSGVLDDATFDIADATANQPGTIDYSAPRLSWTGALAATASVTITYTVTLTAGGDGVVRNVAWAPADPANPQTPACDPPVNGSDPTTGEACAEVEYLLPRLTITKTANTTAIPAPGTPVTYTVTVTNEGPGTYTAAEPATFTDDLSDVLDDATFISATPSSGSASVLGSTLTWTGALAATESATIEYTVAYTGGGNRVLNNTACVPATEALPGSSACDSVQIPAAALTQWKSVSSSATPAVAGSVLTYTLNFRNDGTAAATVDAIDFLTHVLDDADVSAEPTADAGLSATRTGAQIAITGSVPAGQTLTVTYAVTVKADGSRGDDLSANFLMVNDPANPPTAPTDPTCTPTDAQFPDCTSTPIGAITYSKAVTASATPVVTGTELTYTITIVNTGQTSMAVSREDVLTDVLDDATLTGAATSDTASVTVSGPTGDRLALGGDLAAGATALVTYVVTVNAESDRGNNAANNFLVPPGGTPPTECVAGSDQCTSTPLPVIVATKVSNPASGETVAAGQNVIYTLTFTNEGQGAGTVDYIDNLFGVFDDADLTAGPTASNPALTATLNADDTLGITGTLAGGQTVTVSYTVTVKPDGERGNNLLGNVLAPASLVDPQCGDTGVICTENPVSELVQWKSVSSSDTPAVAGSVLTYTLNFRNDGAAAASVDSIDFLTHVLDDADVSAEPTADAGLTAVRTGDEIAVTGSVPAGQTLTVTYEVTVKADGERGDDLAANFLMRNDPTDPPTAPVDPACTPTNAQLPDCTSTPIGAITYSKAVAASTDPVVAGTELTYTITIVNTGETSMAVSREDVLTDVLDDTTLTGPATSDTASVTVSGPTGGRLALGGDLAAGATALVTYVVTVNAESDRGNNAANNFLVTPGGTPPTECVAGSDQCTSTPLPAIVVSKASNPDSGTAVVVGQDVIYTLTFTNEGQADGTVAYIDNLFGVFDDADLTDGPAVSDPALSATLNADDTLGITGTLVGGQTVTVSYTVTVKPDGERGNNLLGNVLAPTSAVDPQCGDVGVFCTENPVSALVQWKSVSSSATPAVAGTVLTYTLNFRNNGAAAANVDSIDFLTHVLDDADVSAEPTADAGLSATRTGDQIAITGSVPAGQTLTVTYEVTVKADGERGDDLSANFLMVNDPANPPTAPTDPTCTPTDAQFPDCTSTPIGAITYSKTVSASATPVVAGTELTYTITIVNTGETSMAVSREDVLTDVLDDATLTGPATSDTASVTVSGPTGDRLALGGDLAAGATAHVTYVVTVNAVSDRGNNAANNFLVAPGGTPPTECVAGSDQCTSTPIPVIVATKVSNPESGTAVVAGQDVTYTLTFANEGQGDGSVDYADNLFGVFDDADLTAGPTANDPAVTATLDADTLEITGTLAGGQTVTVSYTVTVKPDGERGNNRLGNVLAPTAVVDPQCGDAGVVCTENPVPELVQWKTVSSSDTPAVAGSVLTYTLSFRNDGAADAAVDAVDLLGHVLDDADVSSEPVADAGLSAVRTGDRIAITGTVPVDAVLTVTYEVTVKADGSRGDDQAANFLVPNDPENPPTTPETPECVPNPDYPECTNTPIGAITYSKAVAASADPVVAGTELTYTITIVNTGQTSMAVSREDVLTDVLDDTTLTGPATSDTASVTVSGPTDDRLVLGGDLAAGATALVTYVVTVNAESDRGNNAANNFLVTPGGTPPTECVAGSDQCTSTPLPVIVATKVSNPESGTAVVAGQDVTYTLTFTNEGQGAGTVDYIDNLFGVFDDADLSGGPAVSDPALSAVLNADDTLHITGTLAGDQTVTVSYTVTVKPDGERGNNLLGNVLAPASLVDPQCGDAGVSCTENPVPQLESWKSVSAASTPVVAGTVLTYTLFFENTGAAAAPVDEIDFLTHVLDDADVTVEPTADAGLTAVRAGDQIAITGEVPVGETLTVTYQVTTKADGERGDDLAANFLLKNDPTDPPTPPTDPVCTPTDVERPDCTLTPIGLLVTSKAVSASASPIEEGTVLTYTLTFDNQGEADMAVDYTDHLADVLDDATLTADPVASDAALTASAVTGDEFTVTGTIASGQTVTVTYEVTVKAQDARGNNVANNFLVPTGETPPTECVASDQNCTTTPLPNVSVAKAAAPVTETAVRAGEEVTYTLTFTNSGEGAGAVDFTDHLAGVLDDADLTSAPVTSDPALVATSGADGLVRVTGTLAAGQVVTVEYTVTVKADGERGDNVLQNVVADSDITDPQCGDAGVSCTEHPVGELVDEKSVDPASGTTVQAGRVLTYTLTFTNAGEAPVTVNRDDVLDGVLDDATVTEQPAASSDALTVSSIADGRFTVTGELAPGETVTVTYQVTVKEDGERGNDRLDNFLVDEGATPPATCEADNADCTVNPINSVVMSKASDPETGAEVTSGQDITYTVTFENTSQNADADPAAIDATDTLTDVLDDATLTGGPTVSSDDLTAVVSGDTLRITGTIPSGETYTVSYTVTVKDEADLGNRTLVNVVAQTGTPPTCVPGLCTEHEVPTVTPTPTPTPTPTTTPEPTPTPTTTPEPTPTTTPQPTGTVSPTTPVKPTSTVKPGPLPSTGSDLPLGGAAAALLLIVAGAGVLIARRRTLAAGRKR